MIEAKDWHINPCSGTCDRNRAFELKAPIVERIGKYDGVGMCGCDDIGARSEVLPVTIGQGEARGQKEENPTRP